MRRINFFFYRKYDADERPCLLCSSSVTSNLLEVVLMFLLIKHGHILCKLVDLELMNIYEIDYVSNFIYNYFVSNGKLHMIV